MAIVPLLGVVAGEVSMARFVVDIVAQLDLSRIYRRYAPVGGEAIAPEILLVAQAAGVLKAGDLSLDGSKIHADASKR